MIITISPANSNKNNDSNGGNDGSNGSEGHGVYDGCDGNII